MCDRQRIVTKELALSEISRGVHVDLVRSSTGKRTLSRLPRNKRSSGRFLGVYDGETQRYRREYRAYSQRIFNPCVDKVLFLSFKF